MSLAIAQLRLTEWTQARTPRALRMVAPPDLYRPSPPPAPLPTHPSSRRLAARLAPQILAASALYVGSSVSFAFSPLLEWRVVLGLVLGLKAQILFMAPFTASFSRLIGGKRVTNALTTMLCLAPLIGAATGTAIAPMLLPLVGTPLFLLAAMPGVAGLLLLLIGWQSLVLMAKHDDRSRDGGAGGVAECGPHASREERRASAERWASNARALLLYELLGKSLSTPPPSLPDSPYVQPSASPAATRAGLRADPFSLAAHEGESA